MNEVEWEYIQGYEGLYQISNTGMVKSFHRKSEIVLKQTKTDNGYLRLELNKNGNSKKYTIHRLVAQAFLPNPDNLPEVNHLDGDKTNNNDWNLEWSTSSENQIHAFSIGLQVGRKGTKHHNNKLNESDVIELRKLYETGDYKQVELAAIYSLHPRYVNLIIKRRRWKHV